MRRLPVTLLILTSLLALSCKKKDDDKKVIKVKPQLLKLPTGNLNLTQGLTLVSADGANAQSFTPTSIKISLFSIALVEGALSDFAGPSNSGNIYQCPGASAKDCLVEVSDLQALTDALNSAPAKIPEGTYTHVTTTFCSPSDSNKQLLEITGSSTFGGKTYITDTANGIIEGAANDATPVAFRFNGCASNIPLQTPVSAETTAEQKAAAAENPDDPNNQAYTLAQTDVSLQLLFDSRDFGMMGNMTNTATKELVTYGHPDQLDTIAFNDDDDAACKGSKTGLFICAQRTAIYATDALGAQIRRFSIALQDTCEHCDQNGKTLVTQPDAVIYTALVLNDAGEPISSYSRRSVQFGAQYNQALPGDEDYMSPLGLAANDDGSYKLSRGQNADILVYEAFRNEDHESIREVSSDHLAYKATLIP